MYKFVLLKNVQWFVGFVQVLWQVVAQYIASTVIHSCVLSVEVFSC